MGANSKIEWTTHTFNPWWGCTKVQTGRANCYAESFANRWGYDVWGPNKPRRLFNEKHWREPLNWNRKAHKAGIQQLVFCGSMCDVLEVHPDPEWHEALNKERVKLWDLIETTPYLIWMLLTKRTENVDVLLPDRWMLNALPRNVWLGCSASTQEDFDAGWPVLESFAYFHNPTVIFLSLEPLIEYIDLSAWLEGDPGYADEDVYERGNRGIDWVIVGGESGPNARPMHPDWARSVRDQCQAAEVPFFHKQNGEWLHMSQKPNHDKCRGDTFKVHQWSDDPLDVSYLVGMPCAGRLLDGKEWNQMPGEKARASKG